MDLNKAEYKRLGNYIREVDVRNRNLEVTKLLHLQRIHAVHSKYHRNGHVFL
jgi:hypothetical protein